MSVTQKHRPVQISTVLGEDALLVQRMTGHEHLSQLFEYELELFSERPAIEAKKILGTSVTVSLSLEDSDSQRYFNGFVTRFGQYESQGDFFHYRASVRPWLWFLTRAANCRIFQNTNTPDIIKKVFRDQGFSEFTEKLTASYKPREYCVQYRETDFNFVSRLMEEEGIYYFFTHSDGKHQLVLADSANAHPNFTGYETIPYHPEQSGIDRSRADHVNAWGFAHELQTDNYALTDYDFKRPKANLAVKANAPKNHQHASYEQFDYPGYYVDTDKGDGYVRHRLDELQTRAQRFDGAGNARGLAVGYTFKLADHSQSEHNQIYLLLSAQYYLQNDEFQVGAKNAGHGVSFECQFTALAKTTNQIYRPDRNTPKPLVHGAQTAVVVGPSGDEIYTDQYGRVKVKFHWDRYSKSDQESSCWIRVAHPWAGKNWGMVAIPRIGHEVVVDFLEGDPDQPLIIGSVYNADMMPPYSLPGNATQTGIKTRSSKGGGTDNFNELRFEDKKGSEQVYLHAEKNQDIEVENCETHWVGNNRTKTIDHDETTHVKHDRTETVDNNETITIGVDRVEMVGSNETITIGANRTETVGSNETISIGMNRTRAVAINEAIAIGAAQEVVVGAMRSLTVGANQSTTIGVNHSTSVGADQSLDVGADQSITIGANRSTSVGKDDSLNIGKNLVINVGDSITIQTGDASITMKKNGDITIQGKNITLRGSGKINAKADSDVVIKGSKIGQN